MGHTWAEGVETQQQANTLKSLNCDVLQGYFDSNFERFIHKEYYKKIHQVDFIIDDNKL